MEVAIISTRPGRNDIVERPGEVYTIKKAIGDDVITQMKSKLTVSAVRINCLEQVKYNPHVDSEDAEVLRKPAVEEQSSDRAISESQDLG